MKLAWKITLVSAAALALAVLAAPLPRFRAPLSTVVEGAGGTLLGARAAADGQWRFPPPDSLSFKYVTCLTNYEDRWFRYHPGINPVAIVKALAANIKAGEVVRGGSTITMQVARLSGNNPPRTYASKAVEMLSALKLEIFRSKDEILMLYASNAPFGGNTVGVEAAAWRYTGRGSSDISWAEAAALAVLPNAPAMVYPGRNTDRFRSKRDSLLVTLLRRGLIDSLTCSLALGEPLPAAAMPMPSLAPHLTDHFMITRKGERIRTTIDPGLQREVSLLVNQHQERMAGNMIFNAAAIVVEVATGHVTAYAGNSTNPDTTGTLGRDVDVIMSPRSTGSILKPLLYAGLLSSGEMLPNQLIADIPSRFEGFRPENSDFTYSGAVPAANALARSLNIPAVKMLQSMNEERFLSLLGETGFTSFNRPASYYGLSLILGGGEASLWELAGVYSSMARVLINNSDSASYHINDWHMPLLEEAILHGDSPAGDPSDPDPPLSAGAIWLTYEALLKVNRPETETGWQYFGSAPEIAWKTGTSYGFRDAWAVGTTPEYVVAVWAGNADGEGRPGLSGISSAAPLLFDIFRLLNSRQWFSRPQDGMTLIPVCTHSGYRAGPSCTETRNEWVPVSGLKSEACPYHHVINLDNGMKHRVNVSCADPGNIVSVSWFILPPAMEYYFRMHNPSYKTLPPFLPGCADDNQIEVMEFLYPPRNAKIYIPRSISGETMSVLPEIAHRRRNALVYWHLDNNFIGTTRSIHQIELSATAGEHLLTATDEQGRIITRRFTILRAP